MRVCVTGSAGFLGSYIARHFAESGDEVVGLDNFVGGDRANYPATRELDCIDVAEVKELTRGVDVIYHCACTAYEGLSVFSPTLVTQNTLTITAAMLAAAAHNGVKRFVHCSSMSRYGKQEPPFTEDMPLAPVDPYGIAKAAAEQLVRTMAQTHGFEHVIAIPHNIYGPRQKYDDPFRNVAAIMANLLLQGRAPVIYGDGQQVRCLSYIDDVLDVLLRLATEPGVDGEVYNVGPDEDPVTIAALCDQLQDVCGTTVAPHHYPDRPCEVKHAVCSSDKIRERFGYETKTGLKDGLAKLVAYIREHGTKPFRYHLPIELHTDKTPKTWTQRHF